MKTLSLNDTTKRSLKAPGLLTRFNQTAFGKKTNAALANATTAVGNLHETEVSEATHATRTKVARAASEAVGATVGTTKAILGGALGAIAGLASGSISGLTPSGVKTVRAAAAGENLVHLGSWIDQTERDGAPYIVTVLHRMPDGTKAVDQDVVIPAITASPLTFKTPEGVETEGLVIAMNDGQRLLLFANNDNQDVYVYQA